MCRARLAPGLKWKLYLEFNNIVEYKPGVARIYMKSLNDNQ